MITVIYVDDWNHSDLGVEEVTAIFARIQVYHHHNLLLSASGAVRLGLRNINTQSFHSQTKQKYKKELTSLFHIKYRISRPYLSWTLKDWPCSYRNLT